MKPLYLAMLSCSLLPGCSNSTQESLEPPTIHEVACGFYPASYEVPPRGPINIQVTGEAADLSVELLLAIEAWSDQGLPPYGSIEVVEDDAPYDPSKLLFTACSENQPPVDYAWMAVSGGRISIDRSKFDDDRVDFEHRVLALVHAVGHLWGLPDNKEPYSAMNFGAWVPPYPNDVCGAKTALHLSPCGEAPWKIPNTSE